MGKDILRTYVFFKPGRMPERYAAYYNYEEHYVAGFYIDEGVVVVYWDKGENDDANFDVFPFRFDADDVEEDMFTL